MNIIKEVHLHTPHPNVVHMSHIFAIYTKFTRSGEKPSMVGGGGGGGLCQMWLKSKYNNKQIEKLFQNVNISRKSY